LSVIFWKFLKLTKIQAQYISINTNLIKVFLFLIFLQLVIGAFVSGMDAGKVYNTWPLMGSSYFPDDSQFIEFLNLNVFDNPSIVQFIHRNLAYLILGIYIYILYYVIKDCNVVFRKPMFIIGFSLSLQVVFRDTNSIIWSKDFLCIFTPDKFYFNYFINFIFSIFIKL
jgi:cytochrome c oxidase assembly protein subunit 15